MLISSHLLQFSSRPIRLLRHKRVSFFIYVTFMAHKLTKTALTRNGYFSFDSNPLIYMNAGNCKKGNLKSSWNFVLTRMKCRIKLFYTKWIETYWRFEEQYGSTITFHSRKTEKITYCGLRNQNFTVWTAQCRNLQPQFSATAT